MYIGGGGLLRIVRGEEGVKVSGIVGRSAKTQIRSVLEDALGLRVAKRSLLFS